jgi:hypothetical protein
MFVSPELRLALFDVLDQSDPSGLREAEFVRRCLYRVAENYGGEVTAGLDAYVELPIEEFCPDYVAGTR